VELLDDGIQRGVRLRRFAEIRTLFERQSLDALLVLLDLAVGITALGDCEVRFCQVYVPNRMPRRSR